MKNIDTKMDVNLNRGVHVNSIQQTIFRESLSGKSKSSFRKYLHFCILEVGGMYLNQCNVKFHFISFQIDAGHTSLCRGQCMYRRERSGALFPLPSLISLPIH